LTETGKTESREKKKVSKNVKKEGEDLARSAS